jgi:hypothetical protein
MKIRRRYNKKNLVKELALNKVDALELLREALANAKDHGAKRVWIKTIRGRAGSNAPDVILMNDGAGMGPEELSAFWGVSASVKPQHQSIGHKGHGTKLYFASQRLQLCTRRAGERGWRWSMLERPDQVDDDEIEEKPLQQDHVLWRELSAAGLLDGEGVAILIEGCAFSDAPGRLLHRRTVESYCDWFTVVGDVRSGLFKTRKEFHDAIASRPARYDALRINEVPLRPIEVQLSINGEAAYRPIGFGTAKRDPEFFSAWSDDRKEYESKPGILAFGHRFADHHEPQSGAKRVRDDLTALCLVTPESFGDDAEYAVVIRIEGHRRQRETYLEATRQFQKGEYSFDERFGLWLCKDYVPVAQQNEWLREAIDRASQKKSRLSRYEIKTLRNWQVFVNYQGLTLTANRNDVSNLRDIRERVETLLAKRIEKAFDEDAFADWVSNLQQAVARGQREREVRHMTDRVDKVTRWFQDSEGVEPARVALLERRSENESLRLPKPENEQELFYLYAVLSGVYKVPVRVLEYSTREGIDAVVQVQDEALFKPRLSTARVEFKNVLSGNTSTGHYFDAIDAFLCWRVDLEGKLREGGDSPHEGTLRPRTPLTTSKLDTYEVEYTTHKGEKRVIPVLTLESLFKDTTSKRKKRR